MQLSKSILTNGFRYGNNGEDMWWKIYFWVLLILSLIGIIFVYGTVDTWNSGDWTDIIVSIIQLIGLYAFVYKKQVFAQIFWRIFFVITIISAGFYLIYFYSALKETLVLPEILQSRAYTSGQDVLIGLILAAPLIYALYQLGYKKSPSKKKK